jgi:uncharacterized protein (DUF58 family)
MTRTAGPRVEGYAVLAGAALVASLALRRPELAVAAAPFALVLALGLRLARDPLVGVRLDLEATRTLEGSRVAGELTARAETGVDRLELLLDLPAEVEIVDAESAVAVRLRADEERSLPLVLRCRHWGVHRVGTVEVRARDVLRLVVWEQRSDLGTILKAYPREERLDRLLAPLQTRALTGSDVARTKGDGIEYADLRDYVPGDRLRSINWRASARRTSLVVNERHPERNTDVVLLVDSFSDVRGTDSSTLDDAVRAAATLTTRYLDHRDRVGLVSFGGLLRWVQPGLGLVQRFRLIETLLETGVAPTYAWRNVNVIPGRALPSKALVLGLTPLVDARFVSAIQDLRARGYDVAVVELDPTEAVVPGRAEAEQLAYRLWLLQRETLRAQLLRLGIAVSRWDADAALDVPIEEVRTFRRHARLSRV